MALTEAELSRISPMMRQYLDIKEQYKDHVLFFRLGDFYEMFFDDAIRVSKMLELTLTGRDCGLEERAPMCGIPYHSCDIYIKRLIAMGLKVAICEQLVDPKEAKGLVERGVIKVITPGTLTESSMLDDDRNNYLGAVYADGDTACICFCDISTGDVQLFTFEGKEMQDGLIDEVSRFDPSELLLHSGAAQLKAFNDFVKKKLNCSVTQLDDISFSPFDKRNIVLEQFRAESVTSLGIEENTPQECCVCGMFDYVMDTQRTSVQRFTEIIVHADAKYMGLDLTARTNLEITETLRGKERKGSLLWVLDSTKTSMGKRLLKSYLEQPLVKPAQIIARLDAVEQLYRKSVYMQELSEALAKVYDLERLMTRVVYKSANPRDIKALQQTAMQLPQVKLVLQNFSCPVLVKLNENIDTLEEIASLVENAIVDEPAVTVKDGGVIRDGFNEQLDSLRDIVSGGRGIINDIEQREKERTGIKTLKISYNRVFGYYIEVTKSYYELIPADYIRKQTLANCERFITEELKNAENTILGANDKILSLEAEIFAEVRDFIATQLVKVQKTASAIAQLDVLCSFAAVSLRNGYVRPDISIDGTIEIKDGRHPVVELMLNEELFVPNDTLINTSNQRMAIITGPNMSGKSTYMRQVALITLMAQIGCFVPASYARISIVDKIFTRVGASDDLTAGQSTFMVEMSEVSDILKHATKNSLVILDEVGRGTSTFDGISIATAVAEHICSNRQLGCKTLFATHYHELIALEGRVEGVKNFSVAVKKRGEDIKFLRKIVEGGVDDSYGIEVAKLAGLPAKVVTRAKAVLANMETQQPSEINSPLDDDQLSFTAMNHKTVINRLKKTNIDELSDEDAKYLLKELCAML